MRASNMWMPNFESPRIHLQYRSNFEGYIVNTRRL